MKDDKGGHNQPESETGLGTTSSDVVLFKLAHDLVDLLSVNAGIFKQFPKFRSSCLHRLEQLVRVVLELVGEVGHCLAVDSQVAQQGGKVDILALLDTEPFIKLSFFVIDQIVQRIQVLARILGVKPDY